MDYRSASHRSQYRRSLNMLEPFSNSVHSCLVCAKYLYGFLIDAIARKLQLCSRQREKEEKNRHSSTSTVNARHKKLTAYAKLKRTKDCGATNPKTRATGPSNFKLRLTAELHFFGLPFLFTNMFIFLPARVDRVFIRGDESEKKIRHQYQGPYGSRTSDSRTKRPYKLEPTSIPAILSIHVYAARHVC